MRFSGEGLRRVARCDLPVAESDAEVAGTSPALLAAMNRLACRLLVESPGEIAAPSPDWADVHYQSLRPAPRDHAGVQLTASLRAEGALIEVCAHDREQRLLALRGFRPGMPGRPSADAAPSPIVPPL